MTRDNVTVGLAGNLTGFDTVSMAAQEQWIVLNQVYGTLTTLSPDGAAEPGLAESWSFNSDDSELVFELRSDLKFSDGTALTAEDVTASLTRLVEAEEFVYAGAVADIESVRASGPSTVRVQLARPYPSLPTILGQPQFGVFPADDVSDENFFNEPVSAGPYFIAESSPDGSRVVLNRNPAYWGPEPAINTLQFQAVTDPSARLTQLRAGQLDLADSLSPEALDELTGEITGRVVPVFGNLNLVLNNNEGFGADLDFRRAVSLALDREQLNNVAWSGQSEPAYGFFSPTSQWYEASLPPRNIDEARALIAQTDCADGCELPILIDGGSEPERKGVAIIRQNLEEIGVNVRIAQSDYSTIFSRGLDGNFSALLMFIFDYTDEPDVLLSLGLRSDGGLDGMLSGYASDRMDGLVSDALAASGEERSAKIAEINELFGRDLPVVPLTSYAYVSGSRIDPNIMEQTDTSLYRVGRE